MKKIYLLLFFLAIVSCQQEELPRIEETSSPTQEKASLEEINFTDLPEGISLYLEGKKGSNTKRSESGYLFGEIRKDMPAKKFLNQEGVTSYTLVLETLENPQLQNSSMLYFDNLVIYPINDVENLVHIVRYIPSIDWYENSRVFKDFTGTIIFYESTGEEIDTITFTKGKTTKEKNKSSYSECYVKIERGPDFCVGGLEEVASGEVYGDGEENCIETYTYRIVCTMGGGDEYQPYDTAPPEPGQLPSIGGTAPILPEPTEEEDKIDDSELTGKEKCLNDLLDKNGNSFVKDLLAKFKGDGTEFDIKISSKDQVWSEKSQDYVNAITKSPVNNVIEIHISSKEANGNSALAVTRTLLHEYIHADIFRKLETRTNTILELNFLNTFEQYEEDHHEAMGALYIVSMRDALRSFHQNVLKEDYQKYINHFGTPPSDYFYEALAWQGLKHHKVKAYTDLPDEVKKLIEAEVQKLGLLSKDCPQ